MSAEVKIRGVHKAYQKDNPVLRPLDMEIKKGELFFLLGPSGCGKSTLLRIIAGLLKQDGGTIHFDDSDVSSLAPEKRNSAMVFQNYALWPHMTVYENVAFGLRAAGADSKKIEQRVSECLAVVRMSGYAQRRVPSLSGGQQQRVALARALAVDPAVLLLDEPLSNLDAKLRDEMRLEIRRICRERSLTAIYVTHDRREALSMADRMAVLDGGILQQVGSPLELYKRPANRFTASFLGDVNFIPGKYLGFADGHSRVETALGILGSTHQCGLHESADITVMIRPENLRFAAASDKGGTNVFESEIKDSVFLGEHTEWHVMSFGQKLTVNENAAPERPHGSGYVLTAAPENIVLLKG